MSFQIEPLQLLDARGCRAFQARWDQERPVARVSLRIWPAGETLDFGPRGAGEHTERVFVQPSEDLRFDLDVDGETRGAAGKAPCAREWTVFLVQHTHTDIGYTDFQDAIYKQHVDFIRQACDLIHQTKDREEGLRFRWTCEAAWGVARFLREASAGDIERFRECVASGAIEVTGMWWQWTEMCSHLEWARQFEWAARVAQDAGARVTTAMQSDINGFPWSLPQMLTEYGISRFCSAINWYRGGSPEPCPAPFYWEGPDGSRVLAYNGQHYHVGNAIGFHENLETVEERMPRHLSGLLDKGYAYRSVLLQTSGTYVDNSAPSVLMADIAAQWNEQYRWPRMRVATLGEFFDALEAELSDAPPPVFRGDWTDWWADGNASAPREVSVNREAQETIRAVEGLWARGALEGRRPSDEDQAGLQEALHAVAEFDEHTWGASESIREPFSPMSQFQWKRKSAHADKAAILSRRLLAGAFGGGAETSGSPSIVVFNPESWARKDVVTVRVPTAKLAHGRSFHLLDPGSGERIPHQITDEGDGWVEISFTAEIEGFGKVGFQVVPVAPWNPRQDRTRPESDATFWRDNGARLASGGWTLEVDGVSGEITALTDVVGRPLFRLDGPYRPLDLIYERPDRGRAQIEIGRANRNYARPEFSRARLKWSLKRADTGPVFSEMVRVGLPDESLIASAEQRVRLYRNLGLLEVTTHLVKHPDTEPHALSLAFPFEAEGQIRMDKALTWFQPEAEQIPGTARDWYTVESWLQAGESGPVFCPIDAPMIQLGGIHTGQWLSELPEGDGLVLSWLYNNYWTTNFPASASGPMTFRYRIYAPAQRNAAEAVRCGMATRSPLRACCTEARVPDSKTPLAFSSDAVVIVDLRLCENPKGLEMRLWNPSEAAEGWSLRLVADVREAQVLGFGSERAPLVSAHEVAGEMKARQTYRVRVVLGE